MSKAAFGSGAGAAGRAGAAERVDARRNRALVLAAAQRALAEEGTGVSLAEIARRAGVGAGTVHRHFPSKTALLEAVMQQRLDRLTALAVGFGGAPDAGVAFFAFCTEVVMSTPRNQGLCDILEKDGWPRELMREAGERFHRALTALLVAAQGQGAVRADIDVADVLELFTGCVVIQRLRPNAAGLARGAQLVLDALRAEPAGTRVTKDGSSVAARNESAGGSVTPAAHCPVCATPLRPGGAGRPARYCSPACRQKAHRRRHSPLAVIENC
ncbi:TetR/AcrR family transcriptional regulator [Nocardia yamanashiensis]|uniref:TetR/AcrR family transcriptional regulator n=1 Tax=Nocardia yamanashiensis TaxID=209247 RepID=UPI00082AA678|nr:TetR/AcrR family transcriptional regulator [Nocardia yamanashiensis]